MAESLRARVSHVRATSFPLRLQA